MGMYTELVFGCSFKEDIPEQTVAILKYMCNGGEQPTELPEHEFFKCSRWDIIFSCSSFYFGFAHSHSKILFDDISRNWMLSVRASIKNYDDELDKFVNWVRPYVGNGSGALNFLGYSIYEESGYPKLYFLESDNGVAARLTAAELSWLFDL